MRHNILPEFENFLISRQLVPEKNVPFYVIWVGKFLSFLDLNRNINEKSTLLIFIEQLKNQGNEGILGTVALGQDKSEKKSY